MTTQEKHRKLKGARKVHHLRRSGIRGTHRYGGVNIWGVEGFLDIVKANPAVARRTFSVIADSKEFWTLVEETEKAQTHYHNLLDQLDKLRKKLTKNIIRENKPDE